MISVPQFMVTVETKNYPVISIRPAIQRYAKIRKKLNASEIANCLAAHATVILEQPNGIKTKLTLDNFKDILYKCTLELKEVEERKANIAEQKNNTERLNTLIENVSDTTTTTVEETASEEPVTTEDTPVETSSTPTEEVVTEQIETPAQVDPENNGEFDDSAYYKE